MSNPYFQFKKFTVYHDLCGMKVGADGVTLGAWARVEDAQSVLDIGSGSGLISLMLAQRSDNAVIDAIDIDYSSVQQSQTNFSNSPWSSRLNVFHQSLQHFASSTEKKYDLIVSNPPYFQNSLKAPDLKRSTARHTDTLPHSDLIDYSISLLNTHGNLCLILPVEEAIQCIQYAESKQYYCIEKVYVYPNPNTKAKRMLLKFSFEKKDCQTAEITIESERHIYTPEYSALVKDFYLKL